MDVLDRFKWLKNSSFLYDGDIKVYLDPWGVPGGSPRADVIFVTHAHDDHFSVEDIEKVRQEHTRLATTADVAEELSGSVEIVTPGDALELAGISVDVVPAYNSAPDRQNFHPQAKGWVGYVFTLEGTRIYHAGDTDAIPEMEAIDCDIAFLPIGGTFTMTAEEVVDAVRKLGPYDRRPNALRVRGGHAQGHGTLQGAGSRRDRTQLRAGQPLRSEVVGGLGVGIRRTG